VQVTKAGRDRERTNAGNLAQMTAGGRAWWVAGEPLAQRAA
jgi:hypothetical protein